MHQTCNYYKKTEKVILL